jgi:hypothetical protein
VPQGIVGGKPLMALPFSITYPAALPGAVPKGPVEIATFQLGSSAVGSISEGGGYALPATISGRVLGSFGFCRSDGGAEFLPVPRSGKKPERAQYWLDDNARFRDLTLWRFGEMTAFSEGGLQFGHRALDGEMPLIADRIGQLKRGEHWDHVRFVTGEGGTRVVFRTGLITGVATSGRDLSVKAGSATLGLRHPDDRTTVIDTEAQRLIVEHEVHYEIGDDELWEVALGAPADARVTVRLGFDSSKTTPKTGIAALLKDASDAARLARQDLANLTPDQPQSLLPEISGVTNEGARLVLTSTMAATFTTDGALQWGVAQAGPGWAGGAFRLTAWPEDRLIRHGDGSFAEPVPKLLTAVLALPGLGGAGEPISKVAVQLAHDPAPAAQNPIFCQFRLLPSAGGGVETVTRLGGLAMTHEATGTIFPDAAGAADYSHLRFGRRAVTGPDAAPATEMDVRLRLPLVAVEPVGVDVPWGERSGRQPPVLVPLDSVAKSRFLFDVRELVSGDADRQLTARLIDQPDGAPTGTGGYVVIGQEPFTVTKFYSAALGSRGDAENAQVASFDSDTRQWVLKLGARRYHYVFAPQVAGESMDKPRRLEIHDRVPGETGLSGPWLPDAPDGAERMRAVEFRLAPSAEIWIDPTDIERNYVPPEWALDALFSGTGALGVGSALKALRGEFLYGLAVGVDTSRETGIGRGARIAEIAALTGRPLGKPTASSADALLATRWAGVSRVLARRPERLEIWTRDTSSDVAFSPARFSDGVSFALRRTAVHAPALKGGGAAGTAAATAPRVRAHGLKGGALWPVESTNLYRVLQERPESDGGSIERIAFSPIGGDADQKALFLDRKVAVISETRNGFVQRHKVEVLGRIGVFWHRAKHVVVYERTVNPSAQFAPEIDPLGTRTRRPVLRKVSEYIELLQPVRSYPDFPDTEIATSGFLDKLRFNAPIINVDSAWSEEVGGFGWKVPLWNRDAARRRPQVYPRPDIGFVTHAEGDGERPTAVQEALDPDNLWFFADFKTRSDDTDSWPPRLGVDYSALPAPSHEGQAALADSPDDSAPQPSARRIPRGQRRFTWRLGPAAQRTKLNAGRANQPIFAGIETLSFMRASPASDARLEQKLSAATAVADALEVVAPLGLWTEHAAPPAVQATQDALNAFIAATPEDNVADLAAALKAAIESEFTVDRLKPYTDAAKQAVAGFDTVTALVGDLPKRCDKLAEDFLGTLKRKQLLILDAIGAWEHELYATDPTTLVSALKAQWKHHARVLVEHALSDMGTDRLGLGNGVEAARAAIRDFESDVLVLVGRAKGRLEEIRQRYNDGKPWSQSRVDGFRKVIESEQARLKADIGTAVADAKARLSTELDELAQRIGNVASTALDAVGAAAQLLLDDLSGAFPADGSVVDLAIERLLGRADAVLVQVAGAVAEVLRLASESAQVLAGKVTELQAALKPQRVVADIVGPKVIDPAIDALFAGLDDAAPIKDKLDAVVTQLGDEVRAAFDRLNGDGIAPIAEGFRTACAALGGGLGDTLQRLRNLGTLLPDEALALAAKLNGNVDELLALQQSIGADLRSLGNELAAAEATAGAYAERVLQAAGQLGSGGIAAMPGNILRLQAAVASAPDLPNLGFARDRLAYYYRELSEVIDTTPAEAWFGRLGDELKALGLSLPFDRLGERLLPDDLSTLDFDRVLRNFGGVKLAGLMRGYKLPKGATDAIRLSHAFDKAAARAWVAIDINVPIPERRALFSVGPFELDLVNSRFLASVRLEADAASGQVEQTGRASIGTDIEAVISGQPMVMLQKVAIRFERSGGLKVEFDPANIKLNPSLQFIQDTLGALFPDELGALHVIKQDGIPIGVEHTFAMPPIDLMYGTSGVSNIQIANSFALVAYPDFVISDRFMLSRPELPFLFSIFVIGGTGYVTVDTEYRPFDRQLSVVVEAAVGGSAALGFAFGPVKGSVFITLSVALAYRFLPGQAGGGLTVSLVLLVAGNVSVAGLVNIYIGLMLRMSYRDNGQIDGTGTLTVSIRISRFFKISVRANVAYTLRNGQSQSTRSVSSSADVTDDRLNDAKKNAEKLLKARG